MKKLFPFVPSPRAAKRLVNVYRLLRATVGRDEWSTFLGAGGDGDFRAVLLLLALLTGYPSEGTDILPRPGRGPARRHLVAGGRGLRRARRRRGRPDPHQTGCRGRRRLPGGRARPLARVAGEAG